MTTLIKCLVIPADDAQELRIEEVDPTLENLQRAIGGGYLQVLHLEQPSMSLYVDEEGAMKNLPVNVRASAFWRTHNPVFYGAKPLVGDAIITGPPDRRGIETSVPEEFIALIFNTEEYAVEIQFVDDGPWIRNADPYRTWQHAYAVALRILKSDLAQVERVRVVPV
jgi:hypothetical protein